MISEFYYKYTNKIYELFGTMFMSIGALMWVFYKTININIAYFQNFFLGLLVFCIVLMLCMVVYGKKKLKNMTDLNVKIFYGFLIFIGGVYISLLAALPTYILPVLNIAFIQACYSYFILIGIIFYICSLLSSKYNLDILSVKVSVGIIITTILLSNLFTIVLCYPFLYAFIPIIIMLSSLILMCLKHKTLLALNYKGVQEKHLFRLSVLFFLCLKTTWFISFEKYFNDCKKNLK